MYEPTQLSYDHLLSLLFCLSSLIIAALLLLSQILIHLLCLPIYGTSWSIGMRNIELRDLVIFKVLAVLISAIILYRLTVSIVPNILNED